MNIDEAMHRIRTGLKALGFHVDGPEEFYDAFVVRSGWSSVQFSVSQCGELGMEAHLVATPAMGSSLHLRAPVPCGVEKFSYPEIRSIPTDLEALKADSAALRHFVAAARRLLADEYYSGDHPIELVRDLAGHVFT